MSASEAATGDAPVPGLWRRLASFLYEGVLLFGVVMGAGFAYSVVTQQKNALQGRPGMLLFLFTVLGLYFVYFWTRTGQTLAMQTWHVRVVDREGRPLTHARALVRYVTCYFWFLPSLAALWWAGLSGSKAAVGLALLGGVVVWSVLALFHPQRQFWHDALCGTRLITWRAKPRS